MFANVKEKIVNFYKSYYPNLKIEKIISYPKLPAHYKNIKFLFTPKTPYGTLKIDNKFYYIRLKAKIPVFVAIKIIMQNSPLILNVNVAKKLIPFRNFYSKPIDKIDNLIAATIISKNSILTISNTKKPPLVFKNSFVTILIKSNGITITSKGIALTDGYKKDIISIKLKNQILKAKVIGKNLVEVE